MADRLNGYRILILETREEAQFSRLLAEQGADVLQCPMFTIHDAPDPGAGRGLDQALHRRPCDDLVLTTGEGLRRLMKVARRIDVERISSPPSAMRAHSRGARNPAGRCARSAWNRRSSPRSRPPKASPRCWRGSISHGHRVGLQLYPDKDHGALIGAITAQGAEVDTVMPYVYDARAADANILAAIDEMAQGRVDAIALTSSGQVRRLIDVAQGAWLRRRLRDGPGADADRIGRTGGIGRTEIARPAHRHLSGQRGLLHEAADLGDGHGAWQKPATCRYQIGNAVIGRNAATKQSHFSLPRRDEWLRFARYDENYSAACSNSLW